MRGNAGNQPVVKMVPPARDHWSDNRTLSFKGSVANGARRKASEAVTSGLRGNTKEAVDEFAMPYRIALRQPANLPFPDRMHGLIPFNGSPGPVRRAESKGRRDPFLDEAVVLLNDADGRHPDDDRGRTEAAGLQ